MADMMRRKISTIAVRKIMTTSGKHINFVVVESCSRLS